MRTVRLIVLVVASSLLSATLAILGYQRWLEPQHRPDIAEEQRVRLAGQMEAIQGLAYKVPEGLNFVLAAERVTPAVVHIKTYYGSRYAGNALDNMFRDYFDGDEPPDKGTSRRSWPRPQRMSTGSGVILTDDGYIVTNHHVVEDAAKVAVTLHDNQVFSATVVGTDPSTDLALLKVNATGLPAATYGDSDDTKIGQWVLAIGNPFDLTSTVTAGIISAKARNINILQTADNLSIEAFIQTDAVVNPGNSGGALVDLDGHLIGINTAIATQSGSFEGYSFAVPVSLVQKVVDDLRQFGQVQRALLGVSIADVTAELAQRDNLGRLKGVYVAGVAPGSGAEEAGLEVGDVIIGVAKQTVDNTSELQERVARHRPGDRILVRVLRKQKELDFFVTLKNKFNSTRVISGVNQPKQYLPSLGALLAPVTPDKASALGIANGLTVVEIREGRLRYARVEEGFVITHIDKVPVSSLQALQEKLSSLEGGTLIEGIYPDGEKAFYGLGF